MGYYEYYKKWYADIGDVLEAKMDKFSLAV